MNRIIVITLITFSLFSCGNEKTPNMPENALSPDLVKNPASASGGDMKQVPVITFDTTRHDFGSVVDGEKVNFSFHFVNTGNADLIIRHCQASCGCTVPEWPKDPVAPGKEGYISVTFDSKGKSGMVNKTVTIIANTIPNTTTLSISGEVHAQ
ncbi:MAG: hypothetical protein RL021_185 [Bacteroidota bacterium]|jgi:hypothetical protein